MAKDNTLVYVGIGAVALYFFMKSRQQTILPAGTVTVGPVAVAPMSQQTGLLTSFLQKVATSLAPGAGASAPVALPPDTAFSPLPGTPDVPPLVTTQSTQPTLTVTNAEGTTYLSNGAIFDPNANIDTSDLYVPSGGLVNTLTMPTADNSIIDTTDDDYSGE